MDGIETQTKIKRRKKRYSVKEKRGYCIAFKESNLTRDKFCKINGISKSALYRWLQEYGVTTSASNFSEVILPTKPEIVSVQKISVAMQLKSKLHLNMELEMHQLISLVQEMGYAT